jgi:hypothetical protein
MFDFLSNWFSGSDETKIKIGGNNEEDEETIHLPVATGNTNANGNTNGKRKTERKRRGMRGKTKRIRGKRTKNVFESEEYL